jgi:hypothetical protein
MLVETRNVLVLIDIGFGLRDVDARSRLSRFFLTLLAPDFQEEFTAIRQIERPSCLRTTPFSGPRCE